ncbi:MAG: hypothetical protein H6Q75_1195 [Firmicutes bacterium]|nr:hypothetical protein [Bacillota bacterium]
MRDTGYDGLIDEGKITGVVVRFTMKKRRLFL